MNKFSFLFVLLLLLNTPATAQDRGALQKDNVKAANALDVNIPDDIKNIVDNFFAEIIKKNYRPAVEKLLQTSPIAGKDDDYKNILKQLQRSIDMYGNIKKYEIINFKSAGNNYHRINILSLHQKYPTRWELTFYRSPDLGLIVSNLRFDDFSEEYFN